MTAQRRYGGPLDGIMRHATPPSAAQREQAYRGTILRIIQRHLMPVPRKVIVAND